MTGPIPHVMAGAGPAQDAFARILPWIAILIVLVILAAIVLAALRRALHRPPGPDATGLTLHDLRQMLARGAISDEEFRRARDAIIAQTRPSTSEKPDTPESTDGDDVPDPPA